MNEWVTHITRIRDTGKQNLGRVAVYHKDELQFQCVCLEPSWVLNEPYISCVPEGTYPFVKRTSGKYGAHFHIKDVPNRSLILMHTLNYFKQSEGCMGVGERFKYLNSDNEVDITNSQITLNKLLELLPNESVIKITRHEHYQRWCG